MVTTNKLIAKAKIMAVVITTAIVLFSSINVKAEEKSENITKSDGSNISAKINTYILGGGDRVRLTVFGEEDLSGEFEVDGTGIVSLPLINDVKIGGLSLRASEKEIANKFSNGYLKKPKVSIEVLNFRPFFILGEVNKPGSYPYINNLTVINAVATAGGYTYRAKTNVVMVKRSSINEGEEFEAKEGYKILPGDVIRVMERFF